MRKRVDPVLKTLAETSPADWLPLLGLPVAPVSIIDADIAAVLAGAADKVFRVHADPEYLLHLDFQSGHDSARLPRRLRLYNTVLDHRHELPERSVVVVLHPGADSPQLTGVFERRFPGETSYSLLRYQVLRVWQLPVEQLLTGGVGTLPLAPISNVREVDLPQVIARMHERLRQPTERPRAPEMWAATYVLLGMRYFNEVAEILLQGVPRMEESTTYQAIIRKGHTAGLVEGSVREARKVLLKLGQIKLGKVNTRTQRALDAIQDVEQLEQLIERSITVNSWQELLNEPEPRPRSRRRQGGQ